MSNPTSIFQMQGKVFRRGEAGYEDARNDAVWNERKPDRYPDVIVVCDTENDVVHAVRLANEESHHITVRSGGHSFVGNGVRDGGLLIDVHKLDAVTINKDKRQAAVQPAGTGPEFQRLLVENNLYFPTGHYPTVALGGFIIGGGYGWDSRGLGPACLSIEAIDVVLADGTLVHATDENHPDLMWAVRGSGPGFFGVVTRFYLKLYDRPDKMLRTAMTFPIALRNEVLTWGTNCLEILSPHVEISAKVGNLATTGERVVSLTATAFCTPQTGYDLLAPLAKMPYREQAIREIVNEEVDIFELYDIAEALNPAGMRWTLDGIWSDAPLEELLAASEHLFDTMPEGSSFVLWMIWGRFPEQPNACWSSQGRVYLSPNAGWEKAEDDLLHEQWVHGELAEIQHLSVGLQFSDNNIADRPDNGISPENMVRLEQIRASYDPTGVFRSYMTPEESTTAYALSRR